MKKYTLIVGHGFSISNDTDWDSQSDYHPGIWGIKTQKMALKYAKEIVERGDELTVDDYNEPRHHALANKFIKELGIKQELFVEPAPVEQGAVTNGRPATLGALKKHLVPGMKVRIKNFNGAGEEIGSRETFVKRVQETSMVLDKNTMDSWLEFGKAGDWAFDNKGASRYGIDRDGKRNILVRIEYIVDWGQETADAINRSLK